MRVFTNPQTYKDTNDSLQKLFDECIVSAQGYSVSHGKGKRYLGENISKEGVSTVSLEFVFKDKEMAGKFWCWYDKNVAYGLSPFVVELHIKGVWKTASVRQLGEIKETVKPYTASANFEIIDVKSYTIHVNSAIPNVDGTKVILERTHPYDERGATLEDGSEVTITKNFTDTNTEGTYEVLYTSPKVCHSAKRIVQIIDTTKPIITLNGQSTVTIERLSTYTELGATTNEASTLTISGAVNTDFAATYTIKYNATDLGGNKADEVTRTVIVEDTIKPVITLDKAIVFIQRGEQIPPEQHGQKTDDGSPIVTTGMDTVDTNVANSYVVFYDATDLSGNKADQVRGGYYVFDTIPPHITLKSSAKIKLEKGYDYTEFGATVDDGISPIVITGADTIDIHTLGTYYVKYNSKDAVGNKATEVIREVEVVDRTAPIITLIGGNVSINVGDEYVEQGAVTDDGTAVQIDSSNVNVNVAGYYEVIYNAVDASGNMADEKRRMVEVQN